MFEHIGYHFENLSELLYFVEWLQTNFEDPSDFEEYLLEKMPYLADMDDSFLAITSIDALAVMDEHSPDDLPDIDDDFWNIVNKMHGIDQEGTNDKTLPGTD